MLSKLLTSQINNRRYAVFYGEIEKYPYKIITRLPPVRSFLWHDDVVTRQMEIFSALLAICAGNSPVTGEFPTQRPVTRSFDAFFDLCLNKPLSKQSWGWWFETTSRSLWRYCNGEHSVRTDQHSQSFLGRNRIIGQDFTMILGYLSK